MNTIFAFVLFCLFSWCSFSQDSSAVNSSYSVSLKVFDSLSKQPIPLVKVYNTNKKSGTTTTFDGTFRLEFLSLKDSITFYSIGFVKKSVLIEDLMLLDSIFLSSETQLIDEVIVLADKSILYDLISNCKRNMGTKSSVAKTYVEIESYNDADQIELIQGYYNGYYRGYDLLGLTTKNVRFGLQPKHQRLYTSINTSKVFYTHQLFEQDDLFPSNPFNLKNRSLKKKYKLVLNSKFTEGNKTMYVIGFEPLNPVDDLFSGNVWIDSSKNNIHKIILEKKEAQTYPFEGIWDYGVLSNVSMKITKSFSHTKEETRTNFTDLDYHFNYKIGTDSSINIKTHASLHAYDYKETFIEPFIDFSNEREMSRLLSELYIINYDSLFWNCNNEYKSSTDENKNKAFFDDSLTISNHTFLNSQKFLFQSTIGSYKSVYTNWDGQNRIYIKELGSDTAVSRNLQGAIPSEHYNLCAQICFNLSDFCDTIYFTTRTIFDPFKTFYHFPMTKETLVFINIYFDLVEIQRRKLNENLMTCAQDLETMIATYYELIDETDELSKKYFREVNRGLNKNELSKWNDYVKSKLAIDNLSLFIGN